MNGERLPAGDGAAAAAAERVVGEAPAPIGGTFSLMVPRAWQRADIPAVATVSQPGPPAVLAFYGGPQAAGVAPFAQVQFARLERDISAAHWLRFYLDQMRYLPRGIETISDNAADALVGQQMDGRVVATRVMVRLYSSFAFIAVAGAAAEAYDRFKDVMGLAVRSFVLVGRSPEGHVETWQTVSADGGPQFSVAASWNVGRIPAPDGLRGAFELTNAEPAGAVVGKMRVRWLATGFAGSDADEARKMVEEFKMAGVRLGGVLSADTQHKTTVVGVVTAEAVRSANIDGDDRSFEFWQAAVRIGSHRVLVAMLTPAQSQSFYWWAVNRRALETVISTMR